MVRPIKPAVSKPQDVEATAVIRTKMLQDAANERSSTRKAIPITDLYDRPLSDAQIRRHAKLRGDAQRYVERVFDRKGVSISSDSDSVLHAICEVVLNSRKSWFRKYVDWDACPAPVRFGQYAQYVVNMEEWNPVMPLRVFLESMAWHLSKEASPSNAEVRTDDGNFGSVAQGVEGYAVMDGMQNFRLLGQVTTGVAAAAFTGGYMLPVRPV